MYYITLDLEWNQAYAEKALAVQKRLSRRLRGEVIQIGAVKLDKNMNVCGSYQVIVKPKYFKKLHKHVSVLTGITQEQIDLGTPLDEAAERFRRFCGKDFVFLTWGPDDIPMLKENFIVHNIPTSWLDSVYDLQLIFNRQTDGGSKQRSLEYAMEYFEIPQTLPAHDALNDAYFTALVAEKLDVAEGIRSYSLRRGEILSETVIGDADAGEDGYVTIKEMLEDDVVREPLCPVCSKPLSKDASMLHSKGQRYTFLCSCKKDGKMLYSLKLHKNFNDTWRAKCTFEVANADKINEFKESLERSNIKRKARRRKPRRRPYARTEETAK
jgi:DNA polymerase III epsilon subunit-like protein